ncbi:NADH dehydrogenase (ubiquinone) 13 kDa A subunit [Rhodnius prolixus]|uniref:NADH dehydrogenase [ubiquinone] iron-sulfur protein 6, mitochondrial n=2 Tax=Rhodnius TaxID=13248 RepID=R4FK98_RHOPR
MLLKFLNNSLFKRVSNINIPKVVTYSTDVPDTKTHTGQQFESTDYRLVRFVDKNKTVNPKFAIDLINAVPPKEVGHRVVWCDGGGGPTGHPKVYINLDKPGDHTCGYCGLRFVKEDDHH